MITRLVNGRGPMTWRHFAAAAIATAIALTTAQPAWASWTEQTSPSPATNAQFNGVSCTSSTACVAVGSYTNNSGTFQLAETSNGSAWTEANPANPPGATNSTLNGVSCTASWCMAVGANTTGSSSSLVSQKWTGSGWTAQSVPVPAGASSSQLNGVSCTGAGCIAVGAYTTSAGTFPLAESWNGSSWSVQATASPPGQNNSQLNGVSCTSPTSCEAVGTIQPATGTLSLAEGLAGTSWSIQATANPGGTVNNLTGVSCPSATHCVAVGTGIAETWNGTTWTASSPVKPPHDTSGPPAFGGVACVSATSCMAVGSYYDDAVLTATAELWNGTKWKAQDLTVADSDTNGLAAVACPAAHLCTGVGWFQDTTTLADDTLVQSYSLDWQMQYVPPGNGTDTSSLSGLTCSSKYCTAAGTFESGGSVQGFVQAGSGGSWVPRQTPTLAYSSFSGIWCTPTQANCFVVGQGKAVGQTTGPWPLAEFFNGISFQTMAIPMPAGATDDGFNSVSCTSTSSCFAVGYYDVGDNEHALAEVYNGASWAVASLPVPAGSTYSLLNGISCTSASSCVAVGNYGDPTDNQKALVEQLSGFTWTVSAVALPAGGSNPSLNAVSCPTASTCVAVGAYSNGSQAVPLAEKWNGTTWAAHAPPAPSGSASSKLSGITCTSASSCVAVGSWFDSSSDSSTLAEGLNGNTWAIQATPATGSANNEMLGVSCASDISCTAVGDLSGPAPQNDLIEVYS